LCDFRPKLVQAILIFASKCRFCHRLCLNRSKLD
jgi:hypothetical protein